MQAQALLYSTHMRLFLSLIFLCSSALANSQQSAGTYSPEGLQNVAIGCASRDIKSVTLIAGKPNTCTGSVHIKNISVRYKSGLQQFFEYPDEQGRESGAKLSQTKFSVLPGTKCINNVSSKLIVRGERNLKCKNEHRVQILVERI